MTNTSKKLHRIWADLRPISSILSEVKLDSIEPNFSFQNGLLPVVVVEAHARQPPRGRGGRVELEGKVVVLLLLESRGYELRMRGRRPRVMDHWLWLGGRGTTGEYVRPPSAMLLLLLLLLVGSRGGREVVAAGGRQYGGALPRVRRLGILLVLKPRLAGLVEMGYRVSHHLSDLGWVDFDFGCFIVCLILLGQMRVWQNGLNSWAR